MRLEFAQTRYKRNYGKRLRRDTDEIFPRHYVFLHSEKKLLLLVDEDVVSLIFHKDVIEHRHKLAHISKGLRLVKSVDIDSNSFFIVR